MTNNPYSVAGSVLNDYLCQIDEFQDAAEHITGQAFKATIGISLPIFLSDGSHYETHKRDCPGHHAKTLGTEHVLLSLLDRGTLASPSHGVCRLCLYKSKTKGVPIASPSRKNA